MLLFRALTQEPVMETQTKSKIHPLVATAAVAVIVLCAVAVAAITGHLPGTSAQKSATESAAPITAPAPTAAAPAPKAKPAQPKVAQASPPKRQTAAAQPKAVCTNCGTVTGVSEVEVKGEGSGLGAVAGGVAGAVLGSQVGRGGTRTAAGVAGAAGGAYAGHQIEKHMKTKKKYDVGVKMEDGSLRTISFDAPPTWRAGDRVRVVDGKLELAN
ncbi:MAG: glycine zipper 2TM domain-containing protein [Betaproteobacteria bacterium]|nr:MAG: glycine zipper 2TM domain-containing protein [Betaproteobacteria bacterium]